MNQFNLKAVLRQTGLTPETLRAWERRYGAVRPERAENGRRMYSTSDVHRLRLLTALVRRGFRISDLAKLPDLELTKRAEASRDNRDPGAAGSDRSRGVPELIAALDRYDLIELRAHFARVRYQMSPREFSVELVPALMSRIGALIEENRISIAQEHATSQLVYQELRMIYDSLESLEGTARPERRMLFGTREGDYHEIGLFLAAIQCRSLGARCQYLGPNLPVESILGAAAKLRPNALVLGVAALPAGIPTSEPQSFIDELDSRLPAATELWLGGSAVSLLKRPRSQRKPKRTIWIFESLLDLETKLNQSFGQN